MNYLFLKLSKLDIFKTWIVYEERGRDVDSRRTILGGLKCGKKGYQLSKKQKGIHMVRCSADSNRFSSSALS